MSKKEDILKILLINLKIAKESRIKAFNNKELLEAKISLKKFQVNRLKNTHKDLLENEETKNAALFFLNEIYSFKDLSKRDSDLENLLPTMGKIFTEKTLEVIANAMVLDALTEKLETQMTQRLGEIFTTEEYNKAYKEETTYNERIEQLNLVNDLGNSLCMLVKIRFIATTLAMMEVPAKMANLSEIHQFLNSGFQTFKNTKNPENFINTLVIREKEILKNLFE